MSVALFQKNNVITESACGNRFLFQGREYDYDTALYYFRNRWYEPETGRWLSPDPIGISGGLNLYAFCGNDPMNFVDPWGLAHFGTRPLNSAIFGTRPLNSAIFGTRPLNSAIGRLGYQVNKFLGYLGGIVSVFPLVFLPLFQVFLLV